MEEKLNDKIDYNNKKDNDLEILLFFINEQSYKNEKKSNNILFQFISNQNILENESSLILFFEELKNQLKIGNNILIPFLNIYPNLIKAYINSDLDEENNFEYIEIFNILKINSFISRENLFPIYENFSDIYYDMNNIKESDKRLKKFSKVFELWKIFYNYNINKNELKEFNSSSYCFIGGGLEFHLSNEFTLDDDCPFKIEINLLNNNFIDFNNNLIIYEFNNGDNNFKIEFNQIQDLIYQNNFNKNFIYYF